MNPLKTFEKLSAEKQERITRVAVEEFSRNGFHGTSTNTIVDRLGIAKGSIFKYFGDKNGLFRFIFTMSLEKVKSYLREVRDRTESESLFVRLEETLRAGVRFVNKHPSLYRLYLRVMFERQIPHRDEILIALRKYSHDYLKSLLKTARERGEIRSDVDLDMAGFVLDAVMDRFLQAQAIQHLDAGLGLYGISSEDAEPWITFLVKSLRGGLEAHPVQPK